MVVKETLGPWQIASFFHFWNFSNVLTILIKVALGNSRRNSSFDIIVQYILIDRTRM